MSKPSKLSKQEKKLAKQNKAENPATVETKPTPAPAPAAEKPAEEKPQPSQSEKPAKPAKPAKPTEKPKPAKPGKEEIIPVEAEVVNTPAIGENLKKILAKSGRIDANRSVDLMCALREDLKNPELPENLKIGLQEQVNAMTYVNLLRWHAQTIEDFGEAGIPINPETFNRMAESLKTIYGITLKALPSSTDSQMKIDFEGTNATADAETQKTLKKEAKRKVVKELPVYTEGMTEEQIVQAIDDIFGMQGYGMEGNLQNAIEFARQAYKLEKEEPHHVLAIILKKFNTLPMVLRGFEGMSYDRTMKNGNPFLAHTTVMGKMQKYNYTEAQVANIVRTFIADQIERNCKTGGKFEDRSIPIGELLKAFNDKMINDILTSEDPIPVPSIKGLSIDKTEVIDRGKIVNDIERVYGKLDDKKLKKKLQEIAGLYFEDIVPLETLLSK